MLKRLCWTYPLQAVFSTFVLSGKKFLPSLLFSLLCIFINKSFHFPFRPIAYSLVYEGDNPITMLGVINFFRPIFCVHCKIKFHLSEHYHYHAKFSNCRIEFALIYYIYICVVSFRRRVFQYSSDRSENRFLDKFLYQWTLHKLKWRLPFQ